MKHDPQAERWQEYVAEVRQPSVPPFNDQWARFNEIFGGRDPTLPPPPVWVPDRERLEASKLAALMREVGIDHYAELHRWSAEHRAEFWQRAIERLAR